MKKYLKRFNNHSQYEEYKESTALVRPSVSQCVADDDVHYYPEFHFPYEEYVPFEDYEVWKCVVNAFGDYTEVKTTVTVDNDIVTTTIQRTPVSMMNKTATRYYTETTITTAMTTGDEVTGTTTVKEPRGITMGQIQAVTVLDCVSGNRTTGEKISFKNFNELRYFTSVITLGGFNYVYFDDLVIPSHITNITGTSFQNAIFNSVIVEEGVKHALSNSFWDRCCGYGVVVLPSTLETFKSTFGYGPAGIANATNVIIKATTPPERVGAAYVDWFKIRTILYVPDESVEAYKSAEGYENHQAIRGKSELPDELKKYWP